MRDLKVRNLDELRGLALRHGAEAEIDGKRFNSARHKTPVPTHVPEPKSEPSAPPGLTREDVEALLAARDQMWAQQIATIQQAFTAALRSIPTPDPQRRVAQWSFQCRYGENNRLESIDATPRYERDE